MRQCTRKAYHKQVNFVFKRERKLKGQKIANSFLNSNSRDFWKEISKIRGRKSVIVSNVDGYTKSADIANVFSRHYNELYNSIEFDNCDINMLYNDVCDSIVDCKAQDHCHYFNDFSIILAIKKMKHGKNDGYDGLTSDYILNGTPLLYHYLSILFSLMLSHCYAPTSFCMSSMVPIPKKSNGSMSDIKNYRGIALSSLLSKMFDNCIITNQASSLDSDDLQFAYKSQLSTVQCVSSVIETVNYYLNHSSNVYMCMLDASKAFDRVNLLILFKKLFVRSMCPIVLRFLMYTYSNQQMRIKWNNTYSNTFCTANGVKQGGVLSPLLFNVYLQDLIVTLRQQGVGCHLHGMFVGAFSYADDITLLAPTSTSLNAMLDICSDYASSHDLTFNASKTKCMYFTSDSLHIHNTVYFMDKAIEFVDKTELLGISISTDILDRNIHATVQKFYCKTNSVLYDFKDIPCDTKSRLLSTYCLDLYGSTLWNYCKSDVDYFYVAWRKTIRRLWKLPNTTHCNLLPSINDSLPIEITLEKRCIKFIWSSLNSKNSIVKNIALSAISSSFSTFGDNYRYLSYKYNIGRNLWMSSLTKLLDRFELYVSKQCVNYVTPDGTFIRELCLIRDDESKHGLTCNEMSMLIEYLCTI